MKTLLILLLSMVSLAGAVDEAIEVDIRKLTEYYRAFGFFQARVGRTLEFGESGEWVTVRFVIH